VAPEIVCALFNISLAKPALVACFKHFKKNAGPLVLLCYRLVKTRRAAIG